jgi:hypothetical protein
VPADWTFGRVIDAVVDHSCQLAPGCISERHELRDDRGMSDAPVHTMVLGKIALWLSGSWSSNSRNLHAFDRPHGNEE